MRITCNGQLALAVLLTSALVFGCAEHEDNMQGLHSQDITFVPQMVSDWNAPWTRAAAADEQTSVQALQGSDEPLYLHTVVTRGIGCRQQTRGSRYIGIDKTGEEGKTFDTNDYFRVSGYSYTSGQTVADVASANFFVNTQVVYDNEWKATENFVMPAATDKTDFFAWFVADEATAGVEAVDAEGGMQLIYTVPTVIANQPDLLTAVKRGEVFSNTPGHTVPLTFNHQLTEVNFVLDTNVAPGTITEIAFTNVYTKGTLTVSDGITGTWNLTDAPLATAYTVSFATVENSVLKSNQTILGGLMMIPQKFNSEAQRIRITMTIDGISRNLYADLKDTQWDANTSVTYKVSTSSVNVLRIGSVAYPTSWNTAEGVKAAYAPGDTIGVYGVDANGVVKLVNKKYTLDSGNWMPADGSSTLYVPGYTYYAYYPYRPSLAGAPALDNPVKVDNELPTAAQFFSGVVSNWTPATDQSTAALLNAQDLQIGKSTTGAVSTVSFPTMVHAMGLTSLTLESKNIPTTRYYEVLSTGTVSSTSYIDSDDKTSVTPSEDFAASNIDGLNNAKMLNNGTVYYYIQNPSATAPVVPVVSSSVTGKQQWKEASVTLTPTAGAYRNYSATVHRDHVYKGLYYTYRSTETSQAFTPEVDGTYTIECWGAAGGSCNNGGYTYGEIELATTNNLFIYTGKQGDPWNGSTHYTPSASFNGGGAGANSSYYSSEFAASSAYVAASGGGATDVRTYDSGTSWANFTGLLSRIMVAAGGGGQGYGASTAGAGGGINGLSSSKSGGSQGTLRGCSGASQTAGGTTTSGFYSGSGDWTMGINGSFGRGANGVVQIHAGAGGGGGYFGGASGAGGGGSVGGVSGSGGSSFISGMAGCQAYESNSISSNLIKRTGDNTAIHHSGLKFNSSTAITIDGASLMPRPTGGSETGHAGNGFCRIKTPVID